MVRICSSCTTDASLRKGRIYGLLGRNGAGKTTTMRMLLGLTAPSSGDGLVSEVCKTIITFLECRNCNFMTDSGTLSRICVDHNLTLVNNCVKFVLNLSIKNFTDMFDLEACSRTG